MLRLICRTFPKARAGSEEAHHLAVLAALLGAHELQGVGIHEAMVVARVERVESPS